MKKKRPNPDALLARVKRTDAKRKRGALKIFFGSAAGVGKTFAMLLAARERMSHDDVVVGLIETHGRKETEALLDGFELLPRLVTRHKGMTLKEFDLDAALNRRPELILVDELAHTNAPGSRHRKRWQDVAELLDLGIDVYTTLNVQHLESLHEDVGSIVGTRIWETVPDTFFDAADEIALIDLSPDELLTRLREGKIYLPQRAENAIRNFFRKGNLIALRQLALRRTAERVDAQMQEYRADHSIDSIWQIGERILVCIGPNDLAERLVRAAKRLASSLHAEWIAAYVETPELQKLPAEKRDDILRALRLAESLGASTVTLSGSDMADAVIAYAHDNNVTKLVLGKPGRQGWRRWFLGSVVDTIINRAPDLNFYLLGGEARSAIITQRQRRSAELIIAPGSGDHQFSRFLGSLWIPLVCTAAGWPFRDVIKPASILMIYLLGVLLVAIRYGRGPSILASFSSAALFAFFYAPPIFSFMISDQENMIGLLVMLVVAVITSGLTGKVRAQARIAALREGRASALYRLSKELANARSEQEIVLTSVRHIHDEFDALNTVILPDRDGHAAYPVMAPITESLCGVDLGVVRWVMNHAQPAGHGTQTLPGERALYWPLTGSEGMLGVLVMEPANLRRVFLPEQRRLLETFLNQIAQSLERVRSAEQTGFMMVQMEAETLRNSLLNSISHDLRTPLATILGASGSLEEGGERLDAASRKKLIHAIHEEARFMSDQTAKILEMAKLESGKVNLHRQWITVEEIIGSVWHRCEDMLQARRVNLKVTDGLQLVYVDVPLIQVVMMNLLDNACKYSPADGAIDLHAETTRYALEIFVEDNGPGIPAGLEQKIFDKFFRVESEGVQRGVGLGLSICRSIVEAHGGELRVENRAQGGASFQIILPAHEQPRIDTGETEMLKP
ncbi:sensor histidine kinase KdpD [Candidatus Methylospira mobilis]|uniref:histidine kinase n=1 Tax=Candidatus Methylospira mobilis TaxID=1808979 RepID=A0A5Q0BKD9_9GAMM|nr:sensor histidine kinase KdpD [Candidatus Methylospira mobilis]QFY44385.1 sensor histidine kinase KdpD [Candidatus Methylospira mobilis]WNV06179.1 sensor histidine kinase KdpD [Candidatus Methylospira mobilis]